MVATPQVTTSINVNLTPPPIGFPMADDTGRVSQTWTQFLTSVHSKTAAIGPTADAPADTATPVNWLMLQAGGQTYKIPLHQ